MRTLVALLFFALHGSTLDAPVEPSLVDIVPEKSREWAAEVERVRKQHPRDAGVLYQVANLYLQVGRKDDALRVLEQMVDTGAGLHPRARDGYAALIGDPRYQALIARIKRENPAVHNTTTALKLREADLVPEGVAWSSKTRRFYFGSVKKKILAVLIDEKIPPHDLVPPGRDGLGVVVGLRVDEARQELWVASHGAAQTADVNGVFRYKLPEGTLIARYTIPVQSADLLNDLAVTADGTAYVTSTNEGALYRIAPGAKNAEYFLPPKSLPDPNGVTASADGTYLFVAGWYGIARIELANKVVHMLRKPSAISDACIDGLYRHGARELVGIQNCAHESGRVVQLFLDEKLEAIDKLTVLSSYEPQFEGITTGAIADGAFYFMANTQFRKLGPGFKPLPGVRFDPIAIFKLPLPQPR